MKQLILAITIVFVAAFAVFLQGNLNHEFSARLEKLESPKNVQAEWEHERGDLVCPLCGKINVKSHELWYQPNRACFIFHESCYQSAAQSKKIWTLLKLLDENPEWGYTEEQKALLVKAIQEGK